MADHQAPPSLGFSRQEYWSGLPFPSPMHACMLSHFSCVWLCATLWTAAHQAPLSTEFSRQWYWSRLPFPFPLNIRRRAHIFLRLSEVSCMCWWLHIYTFSHTSLLSCSYLRLQCLCLHIPDIFQINTSKTELILFSVFPSTRPTPVLFFWIPNIPHQPSHPSLKSWDNPALLPLPVAWIQSLPKSFWFYFLNISQIHPLFSILLSFSPQVVSMSLRPHGLQHTRHPCPSLSPRVCCFMSIESVMLSNHLILFHPSCAFILSQHQGLFQWVGSSHRVAEVLELHRQHQSFQWVFRVGFF